MSQRASSNSRILEYFQLILPGAGTTRIAILLLVSILFTLWVTNSSVTAESLFQSPESPVAPPPTEPPPPETVPTETSPAPEQPPVAQPTQPTAQEQPPGQQPPAQQPPLEQSTTPIPPGIETVTPGQPTPTTARTPRSRENQDTASETSDSPNLTLDETEFIDTVVVSGAYLWLCCGVMLFLLVPIIMIILYIRGRSKISKDEGF